VETLDRPAIVADAVFRNGLAALHDLPLLLENANIEGRKEFVRAFIGRHHGPSSHRRVGSGDEENPGVGRWDFHL
jgi:hypothetical protein